MYPSVDEVVQFAVDQKVLDSLPLDTSAIDALRLAAIEQWETETLWKPFLATAMLRVYEPQGPVIDLKGNLLVCSSVSVASATLTENVDYLNWGRYIKLFFDPQWTIAVSGLFGYATDCPADVSLAIKAKCAAILAVKNAQGPASEVRMGDVLLRYHIPHSAYLDGIWDSAVKRYRRKVAY